MVNYIIFLFIIKKILSDCFDRCITCTEEGNQDYHYCLSCKDDMYLKVGSNNCYYDYELPGLYLDSDNIFYYCSENCYECINNQNTCMSCRRGFEYDKETKTCINCYLNFPNKYIFVSDEYENCQGLESSRYTCQLKSTKCTNIDINTENYECPREYPLFLQGTDTKECVYEIYDSNSHLISNNIIKTQWLNKRIQIGGDQCWYIAKSFSSKNDLIMETNIYVETSFDTNRFFFGIKSNGRPFFYDDINNQFIEQKTINAITSFSKFESQLIKINLVNDDDKDYYLSCSFTECSIEIADFYNDKIIGISQYTFFGAFYWSTKIFDILELKNEKYSYLFCFIALNYPTHYVFLQKFKFYNPDLREDNSYEKVKYSENNEKYSATQSKIISCFEISTYNLIQCFYININKYFVISLFNENSLNLIKTIIINDSPIVGHIEGNDWDYFFQNILLKNEISILSYVLNPDSNLIYIQAKNLIYKDEEFILENCLLKYKIIEINSDKKYSLSCLFFLMELKRINDNRFCLLLTSENLFNLYIILFDFYNYRDSSLFIRYYNIPLKFYDSRIFQFILSVNFNGFLGLVYTIQNFWWIPAVHYFSIFSYINGIDSELITLESTSTIVLTDFINEQYIENNLFGVIFYGIKILKLPKNIGVYYFSQKKNNLISENDILDPSDIIIFVYDYTNLNIGSPYTIEMAGVVKEPIYSEFNKYPEYYEYYGSITQESFFNQRILVGKTIFYNFSIIDDLTGINDGTCKSNCKVCYNNYCVKCLDNYVVKENPNICIVNGPINGYYYDQNSFTYKKCYESCKECSNGPILYDDRLDAKDSNCDSCINDYYKVINTNNCLYKDNPPFGHYLDINKKLFVNCYENCKTCEKFKKNSTYFSCSSCDDNTIFYEKSSNCLNCSYIGKYVNYYQYKCIDNIPDGYFLSNSETKLVDKCYITCKHCDIQGNSEDHKCTECAEAFPYNFNNGKKCLDDCKKENLYLEYQNSICYDDCSNNNLNNKKYNYKNKCISLEESPKNYILDENNNFISKCDPKKDYEFNNECYNSCPDGTELDKSITEKNMCICKHLYYINGEDYICINSNVCPTDYPYLKIGTSECSNCPVVYKGKCLLKCPEGTCLTQININLATCVDKLDDTKILGGLCFDDFLRVLDGIDSVESKNIVMNENPGVSINIYTSEINLDEAKNNEKNINLTFIDLGECENKLREYYRINDELKFCIISVDLLTKYSNKSTNDFAYELYLDNGTQIMDLSPCNEYPISISSPIINLDLVNFEEAEIFDSQGYDIYNLSSNFYNDKCTAAYINGNDIIIKDRIDDIYPHNVSFCPNGCILDNTEINNKRFNCSCNISLMEEPIENESEEIQNVQTNENYISYLLDMINYKLFGCPKIFKNSSFKDYISNIGLYIGSIVILFNIISIWIFYCYFLFKIRGEMHGLIPTEIKLKKKLA